MQISIIIPTFNEEDYIQNTIECIKSHSRKANIREIIVADGGSSDKTLLLAEKLGAFCIKCQKKGRAAQMNTGARISAGQILYFLHADTLPPSEFDEAILHSVNHHHFGSFMMRFDSPHWFLKFMAWFTRFRMTTFQFGDQSLYCTRSLFSLSGGFDEQLSILEDQDLVYRLKRLGKFDLIQKKVVTSARSFERNGPIRLLLIYVFLYLMYKLGMAQSRLTSLYRKFVFQGKS